MVFFMGMQLSQAQTAEVDFIPKTLMDKTALGSDTGTNILNQTVESGPVYTYKLIRRKESGQVEVHKELDDIFIVQKGQATIIYGGEHKGDIKENGPELLGGKIEGGTQQVLISGDIIMIPANMPHQLILKKGTTFVYLVTKIKVNR